MELEKQAEKSKAKIRSLKSQVESARKAQKNREQEENKAKTKIEVGRMLLEATWFSAWNR